MRHISLSTCGIVPRIYELADKKLGLTLSVSLHAPNDELRSKTMPVNDKYGIDELMKACKYYADTTSRRISFEYAMIKGVNDTPQCAKELGTMLKGTLSHINLIPVNSVKERDFVKSDDTSIKRFVSQLEGYGLTVTVGLLLS
jgi:23S rRNA (adenine2503-C2)-methyltransferase